MTRTQLLALLALCATFSTPRAVRAGCLPDTIPDNGYDGSLTFPSMLCCPYIVDPGFPGQVSDVNVSVAITHSFIGDLVIKLKSPIGTVSTIQSRAGLAEGVDDGTLDGGDGSDWAGALIRYDEQSGGPSAETMGSTIGATGRVCTDDGICAYKPAHDSGIGGRLDTDFDGESHVGTWLLCVGDASSANNVAGTWNDYQVEVVVNRTIPCVCSGKFRGGDRVRYAPVVGPIGADALRASALPETATPPLVGTGGEVMCGATTGQPVFVKWDGPYAGGGSGTGICSCPTGSLASGETSGFAVGCQDLTPDLPWLDDFESGNTNHWSSAVG